jgi:hypothetical protein
VSENARRDGRPAWVDGVGVAAAMVAVAVLASRGVAWDEPLGQDANRYLKNAVAMAGGDWAHYHGWRGPLHAAAVLTVARGAGLIAASKAVSLAASVALVPVTWAVGWATVGRRAALGGVALLACWPDLWWTAGFSTPYPLLTLGVAALVGAAAVGAEDNRWAPVIAGLAAAAVLTDLRAQAIALALGVVAAAQGRRGVWVALLAGVAAARLGLAVSPVPMAPLGEQIREHMAVIAEVPGCRAAADGAWTALVGRCGASLILDNLARAQTRTPLPVAVWVGLAIFGVSLRPRAAAWLAAPVAVAAVAFIGTRAELRYVQTVLPLGFLLVAAGLIGEGEPTGTSGRLAVAVRSWAVVALCAAMIAWPGSLWARAHAFRAPSGTPDAALGRFIVPAGEALPFTRAARVIAAAPVGDRVIDCATADLAMRLYPRPVHSPGHAGRLSATCRRWLAEGPTPGPPAWLLIRDEGPRWAGWGAVWRDDGWVVVRGAR